MDQASTECTQPLPGVLNLLTNSEVEIPTATQSITREVIGAPNPTQVVFTLQQN